MSSVSFQGERGAYSEAAAKSVPSVPSVACSTPHQWTS